MTTPRITVLVLAAGRSRRFGARNKLVAPLDGSPVIVRTVEAALSSTDGEVLVITDSEEVRAALAGQPVFAVAPDARRSGIGHSIATGVRRSPDPDAWLVWPGDMPLIRPETARTIVGAFDPARPAVPSEGGRFGHPVLFPAVFREGLEALDSDRGARSLLSDPIVVHVEDPGIHADIDSPVDLRRARETAGSGDTPDARDTGVPGG